MKRIFTIIFLVALCCMASAQEVYSRFYQAVQEEDSAAMAAAIAEIRASGDQSAERYVAEYNYYVNNALLFSGMTSSVEYPDAGVPVVGDNIMELTDSTGKVAGYMYFVEYWDEAVADSGLAVISKGIGLYPERLDMHFGKIHFLRQLRRWEEYSFAILTTLEYAEKHRKTMVFPDSEDPIDTILVYGILDYERTLFEAIQETPENTVNRVALIGYLRGVAEHMLRLYPKDVFSLNIMAVTYQLVEDRENSLKWLLKAEKAAPKDALVLSNIADTYHMLGDKKNERKYLEKVIKYDDGEYAERAKHFLQELNQQ